MSNQFPVPGRVIPANSAISPGGYQGLRGLTGEEGAPGKQGPHGPIGNFNITTAPFTVPNPGSTVTVPLADASWASVGQMVYVEWSGLNTEAAIFQITAVNGDELTLLNPVTSALGTPSFQPFRYLSGATALTAGDSGWYFLCAGGNWILSLPEPELALSYFIRNDTDIHPPAAIITLQPAGGRRIDEKPLLRLYPGESCQLFTDGANWRSLGLSAFPIVVPEPLDAGFDLFLDKGSLNAYPNWPLLWVKYRDSDKRTVLSGDGWIGFIRGADPENNPSDHEAWIGVNGNVLELQSNPGTIRLAQPTTINGRLTVPAGGANITGGLTIPSGGFTVSAGGANITGAFTANTQGNWATFNSNGAHGIQMNAAYDGTSTYKEMLRCNPAYDNMTIRAWHYHGVFACISLMIGASRYDFRHDAQIQRTWDGATVVWVASDARNKRDIGPCEADALEILRKIPIQAYTHIKDGIRRAVGWVAQSVEKVLPDWVQETKSSDLDGNTIITKRVEPNDQGLPYLIRAIQQLDERFTKLEERLTRWEEEQA